MDKMLYKEMIDVENAKYLLSLNDFQWGDLLNASDKDSWNGETIWSNMEVYIKQLKKWLKVAIKDMEIKGYINTEYKYSSTLQDCGRIYVKGFGVQRLTKELRGFLIADHSVDIDIKNCHPVMLKGVLKNYFDEIDIKKDFPFLRDYIKHRNKWLTEYGCTKVDILKAMNSGWKYKTTNKYLLQLDLEFKKAQALIFNALETKTELPKTILARKQQMKQNKHGKYLNVVLTYYENQVLQSILKMDKVKDYVHTPMFDGFTMKKLEQEKIDEILEIINEHTYPLGVKWVTKDHDLSVVKDEGVEILPPPKTYDEVKEEFEVDHFIIENPLMFGRLYQLDGEDKYQFYNKEKFRDLVKPVQFADLTSENPNAKVEFFTHWLEDPNRLSYKEVKFLPRFEHNVEIFNSFKGFTFENEKKVFDEDPECVTLFKDHLSHLTNHDQPSIDYLMNYIAHLLQKPWELPKTAIILKSKQGHGKDTLIDMIQKMIGKQHIFRTAEIDDIFGAYNIGIRDKLVLQLNEVDGKDGFSKKEKIKNMITEGHTQIREKYVSQYDQTNYLRIFFLSNNLNPIEITHDDRRFCVFKAHHKKPSRNYFESLHGMIQNDTEMSILFNYLMSLDISKYSPDQDRPKTDAYNTMKEHNQNPIYKFLFDNFIKDQWRTNFESEECKKRKDKDEIFCKSSSLFQYYKDFLSCENLGYIVPTYKIVKTVLADIGIHKKQKKINGINNDWYVINIEDLKDQLESYDLEDDVEELNDDDFE